MDAELNFTGGVAYLTLAGGILCFLCGVCGCLTAKFKKPCFAGPFMLCAFIIMILCFVAAALALAGDSAVKEM